MTIYNLPNFPDKVYDYLATIYATYVMESIRWCLENDGYQELLPYAKDFLSFAPFLCIQYIFRSYSILFSNSSSAYKWKTYTQKKMQQAVTREDLLSPSQAA